MRVPLNHYTESIIDLNDFQGLSLTFYSFVAYFFLFVLEHINNLKICIKCLQNLRREKLFLNVCQLKFFFFCSSHTSHF